MELKKIKYAPEITYSHMRFSNTDIAKLIGENLIACGVTNLSGVLVELDKTNKQVPFKVKILLLPTSNFFKRNLDPGIAALLRADDSLSVSDFAIEKFRGVFFTDIPDVEHVGKKMICIEFALPMVLSNLIVLEPGTQMYIDNIKQTSKSTCVFDLVSYKEFKKEHKSENKRPQHNNGNNNRNYDRKE